jgi:phage protein D
MVGKEKQVCHIAKIYRDKETAMRAAQSLFEQLQRGIATFSISLATGQPDLFPETPIRVYGFKEAIDQQLWVINKITHTLSNSGFFSNLELNVYIEGVEITTKEN